MGKKYRLKKTSNWSAFCSDESGATTSQLTAERAKVACVLGRNGVGKTSLLRAIIKDIERVIRLLVGRGDMAILLVEQYFDFARNLADSFAVMDRGEVVLAGAGADMVEEDVRRFLTV